jgi:hypothetical protein
LQSIYTWDERAHQLLEISRLNKRCVNIQTKITDLKNGYALNMSGFFMSASADVKRRASTCARNPNDCLVAGDNKTVVVASLMIAERKRGPGKWL